MVGYPRVLPNTPSIRHEQTDYRRHRVVQPRWVDDAAELPRRGHFSPAVPGEKRSLLSLNSRHFLHQKIPSDQSRNEDGFGHAAKCGGSTASDTGQVIAIGPAHPLDHADVA